MRTKRIALAVVLMICAFLAAGFEGHRILGTTGTAGTTDGGGTTYITNAGDHFAIGGTDSSALAFFDVGKGAGDSAIKLNATGSDYDVTGSAATWTVTPSGAASFATITNAVKGSHTCAADDCNTAALTVTAANCTASAIAFCSTSDPACQAYGFAPKAGAVDLALLAPCANGIVVRCMCLF